jgi:hypothetical protein
MLSPEELLAGSSLTFEVEVPTEILHPTNGAGEEAISHTVRLRPLTVGDLQLVTRAAKENDSLLAALMVQRALVEPEVSVAQVSAMHVGLLQFLLREVNRLSGIETSADDLSAAAEAPISKAAFVLAEKFGWTPQEVNELTLGQLLLHLQMLGERTRA